MNNIVSWAGITHRPVVRSWECSAREKYSDLFWSEYVLHWPRLLLTKSGEKNTPVPGFCCVCSLQCSAQTSMFQPRCHSELVAPELPNPSAELAFVRSKGRTKFFLSQRARKFQFSKNHQPVSLRASCFNQQPPWAGVQQETAASKQRATSAKRVLNEAEWGLSPRSRPSCLLPPPIYRKKGKLYHLLS